ncbi:DNA-binding protein WhiA [Anaerococcus sp. Marseille-Q7828]|uniref:DNA-binding protein WhiA n=1 Tax=Anaerococcus sp. Marseille-Q7828 TaxID=3036300 RepID=UPI0024ADE2A1|nr:DNA-binding protein WhiA [Anaerococcus sp. Marseille-Q7828]
MSFSKRCKKEVLKKDPIDAHAELLTFFQYISSIRISNASYQVIFKTYSNTIARYIYNLIKKVYDYSPIFEIKDMDKDRLFSVIVEDESLSEELMDASNEFFINKDSYLEDVSLDDIKSYLKIAFVLKGSVNDPQRGYNLELSTNSIEESILTKESMDIFDLKPKINDKGEIKVVYLKDSDKISDFLAIIGANKSLFELEDVRAMKSIRNNINRQTNFDKANIDRTVNASLKQVDAIKAIFKAGMMDVLSAEMKELAELRLVNPYTSIEELGQMLDPPMSKSKVNYRLQKFIKMAEDL